jgi:hypothetical protein
MSREAFNLKLFSIGKCHHLATLCLSFSRDSAASATTCAVKVQRKKRFFPLRLNRCAAPAAAVVGWSVELESVVGGRKEGRNGCQIDADNR